MNQHDLMVSVLTAAGGEPIEHHAAPSYTGKIADILFPAADVIVEVKSLTTDRAASGETSEAVGRRRGQVLENTLPLVATFLTGKGLEVAIEEIEDIGRALVQSVFNDFKSTTAQQIAKQCCRCSSWSHSQRWALA